MILTGEGGTLSHSFKYLESLQKLNGFKCFFPNYEKKNSIDLSDGPSLE